MEGRALRFTLLFLRCELWEAVAETLNHPSLSLPPHFPFSVLGLLLRLHLGLGLRISEQTAREK